MTELVSFVAARDFLIAQRSNQQRACEHFRWPVLEHFNWALDYFDAMARGNSSPALHIVEESGDESRLSC